MRGVGDEFRRVAGPPFGIADVERFAGDLLDGVEHLTHAEAAPVAAVERAGLAAGVQIFHRQTVRVGQITDMDVVPNASAVPGWVVPAKDGQGGTHPSRHLRHKGHQFVGHATGGLANQSGFVGSDRVEVTQQGDLPVFG